MVDAANITKFTNHMVDVLPRLGLPSWAPFTTKVPIGEN